MLLFFTASAAAARHTKLGHTTTSHFASLTKGLERIYKLNGFRQGFVHFPVACNNRFTHKNHLSFVARGKSFVKKQSFGVTSHYP